MNIARAIVALSATSSNSTRPAPTAASVRMKISERTAPRRAGWLRPHARHVQASSAITPSSARPLVRRWEYSISVATLGARGTISPLQSGQCAPHPAPDPDARTYAPQRMTARL